MRKSKKGVVVSAELRRLTPEQVARLRKAYERREKRRAYNRIRNAREAVREARKAYNRKRWEDEKAVKRLTGEMSEKELAAFLRSA